MEQIEQLKKMRDDALARLEASADYKLVNSLGALIEDLEEALGIAPAGDQPDEDSTEAEEEESAAPAAAIPVADGTAQSAVEQTPGAEAQDGEADVVSDLDVGRGPATEADGVGHAGHSATNGGSAVESAGGDDAVAGDIDQPGSFNEASTASLYARGDGVQTNGGPAGGGQADDVAAETEEALQKAADRLGEIAAAEEAEASSEADAISRAIEELDADLASAKFSN